VTNAQLYLAIGLPVVLNLTVSLLLFALLRAHMNTRFDAVERRFEAINQRFDDMRDLWRSELKRVEEVFDARLKHLEQR
jgi:hypothetical protein